MHINDIVRTTAASIANEPAMSSIHFALSRDHLWAYDDLDAADYDVLLAVLGPNEAPYVATGGHIGVLVTKSSKAISGPTYDRMARGYLTVSWFRNFSLLLCWQYRFYPDHRYVLGTKCGWVPSENYRHGNLMHLGLLGNWRD